MSAFRAALRPRAHIRQFCCINRIKVQESHMRCDKVGSQNFCNNASIVKDTSVISDGNECQDPARFFFLKEVQEHLKHLNMKDISKIFRKRKEGQKIATPEIKFLTKEELEEEVELARKRAEHFLQCPPILSARKDVTEILSEDPELQGYQESKILFTDISLGRSSLERLIVARDPDGTLRKASWDERHRMNQVYFPQTGCSMFQPKLFNPENLQSLLNRSEFEFLLDRACSQFEPDDPEFIRVTSTTYYYINDHAMYDSLRGTRHFGSMVFYLIFHGKIDNILLNSIATYCIDDAVTMLKIYYVINPDLEYTPAKTNEDTDFIQEYIEKHSTNKSELRKMISAYLELNLPSDSQKMEQNQ